MYSVLVLAAGQSSRVLRRYANFHGTAHVYVLTLSLRAWSLAELLVAVTLSWGLVMDAYDSWKRITFT